MAPSLSAFISTSERPTLPPLHSLDLPMPDVSKKMLQPPIHELNDPHEYYVRPSHFHRCASTVVDYFIIRILCGSLPPNHRALGNPLSRPAYLLACLLPPPHHPSQPHPHLHLHLPHLLHSPKSASFSPTHGNTPTLRSCSLLPMPPMSQHCRPSRLACTHQIAQTDPCSSSGAR